MWHRAVRPAGGPYPRATTRPATAEVGPSRWCRDREEAAASAVKVGSDRQRLGTGACLLYTVLLLYFCILRTIASFRFCNAPKRENLFRDGCCCRRLPITHARTLTTVSLNPPPPRPDIHGIRLRQDGRSMLRLERK